MTARDESIAAAIAAHGERIGALGRVERALLGWSNEQVADLCALLESKQLTPELAREALDPGIGVLMVGTRKDPAP